MFLLVENDIYYEEYKHPRTTHKKFVRKLCGFTITNTEKAQNIKATSHIQVLKMFLFSSSGFLVFIGLFMLVLHNCRSFHSSSFVSFPCVHSIFGLPLPRLLVLAIIQHKHLFSTLCTMFSFVFILSLLHFTPDWPEIVHRYN
jgi:hypothetical protein